MASTLFDKIWRAHLVSEESPQAPAVMYIDLHLVHEVTSPQAFQVLRERGLRVRRTDRTMATLVHSTPSVLRNNSPEAPQPCDNTKAPSP